MSLSQELLAIGLTNKEAEVYLATLQLGYASVIEISNKANVNRTTAYTHIKNLITRGLINGVEKGGKVYYLAEKPDKLKYLYEQQEKEIRRKREMLDKILPKLESIYNVAKGKPEVRYYSYNNENNLQNIRQEIVDLRAREVYNIFNYSLYKNYINKKHIESILDSCGNFKAIYIAPNRIVDNRLRQFQNNETFKLRFLSSSKFDFLSEILVASDNVYIAGQGDLLVIKDSLFSQTLALLFEAMWGMAENFD